MKKLLCVLLSAIFLAGCGGQAIAPTPTPTPVPAETPSPTPEATPEPLCAIPHHTYLEWDQLVTGGDTLWGPFWEIYALGSINMRAGLAQALERPENKDKYFAVAAGMDYVVSYPCLNYDGLTPGQWFAERGFRILSDEGEVVKMLGTRELLLELEGKCPGMSMGLWTPPNVGMVAAEQPASEDLLKRWQEMMQRWETVQPAAVPEPVFSTVTEILPHVYLKEEEMVLGLEALWMQTGGLGEIAMSGGLSLALEEPENANKYFAIAVKIGEESLPLLYRDGATAGEWFAQRGFRVFADEGDTVRMVATKEMILGLEGKCPGMVMSLISPNGIGTMTLIRTELDDDAKLVEYEQWKEIMKAWETEEGQ